MAHAKQPETQQWRMRRLSPSEGAQLWHCHKTMPNGNYLTLCGLQFGIAGSTAKPLGVVPAGACKRCLGAHQ